MNEQNIQCPNCGAMLHLPESMGTMMEMMPNATFVSTKTPNCPGCSRPIPLELIKRLRARQKNDEMSPS